MDNVDVIVVLPVSKVNTCFAIASFKASECGLSRRLAGRFTPRQQPQYFTIFIIICLGQSLPLRTEAPFRPKASPFVVCVVTK